MIYNFPATRFANENSLEQQLVHIISEMDEVSQAYNEESPERLTEEIFDLLHSVETAIRMIEKEMGKKDMAKIELSVWKKNLERGYYGEK
jgi:hypothetical protein